MLADPRHGIEGLKLPKGGRIRDQTFADDRALYLKGDRKTSIGPRGYLKSSARPQGLGSTRINPPPYGRAGERESGIGGRKSASNGSPEARASDT
jgi:hypothetical protein